MAELLRVEVVYALPDRQQLVTLTLAAGSTAADAIARSGLLQAFPEIDLVRSAIGIFSKIVKPETVLRDHDRVEIYRPLQADPKDVRRQRVEEGRSTRSK